jgi:1-phosphofructokinase
MKLKKGKEMRKNKMIYTITVNPCLDVLKFLRLKGKPLTSGTYRPEDPNKDETERPGGKGIDVSRCLFCLRCETTALGLVGQATGEIVQGLLNPSFADRHLNRRFWQRQAG